MRLTADEMEELAHQPKDMIKECRFDGETEEMCNAFMTDGGTKFVVPKFGICYTFNFRGINKATTKPLKVHHAGPDHGLNLILDIQS